MQAIWLLRGFIHANVPPFVLQLPLPCSSAFPLLSIATDAFFCSSLLQTLRLRPPFALPSFPLLLKHDECEVHTDMPSRSCPQSASPPGLAQQLQARRTTPVVCVQPEARVKEMLGMILSLYLSIHRTSRLFWGPLSRPNITDLTGYKPHT